MRSPRRLGRGALLDSVRSGEAVAVTGAPLDYEADDSGYDGTRRPVVPASWLGQLPDEILEMIVVALLDSVLSSGADPAALAAAC
jgi:hypothetical protein